MIRRNSIVTKLWLTILVLVSLILFIVSVLMLEFFNSFHIDQERGHLAKLGGQVQSVLLQEGDTSRTVDQIIEVYGANYILENGIVRSNFGTDVDELMTELGRQDWETYQAVGETAIGNFSSFNGKAALAYRTTFSLETGVYTLYLFEPLDAISSANEGARAIIFGPSLRRLSSRQYLLSFYRHESRHHSVKCVTRSTRQVKDNSTFGSVKNRTMRLVNLPVHLTR